MLFYNIAEALQKDFVPLMAKLMPIAFEHASKESTVIKLPDSKENDFGLSSDSENDEIRPSDNVVLRYIEISC